MIRAILDAARLDRVHRDLRRERQEAEAEAAWEVEAIRSQRREMAVHQALGVLLCLAAPIGVGWAFRKYGDGDWQSVLVVMLVWFATWLSDRAGNIRVNEFDVLRFPSARALRLARLLRRSPPVLALAVGLGVAAVMQSGRAWTALAGTAPILVALWRFWCSSGLESARGEPEPAGRGTPASGRGLPGTHSGRSRAAAAIAMRLPEWRPRPGAHRPFDLLALVWRVAWLLRGPIFGAAAVLLVGEGLFHSPDSSFPGLAAFLAGTAPNPMAMGPDRRLFLLGLDAKTQTTANLRGFALLAVLPTMVAAAAAAAIAGPTPARAEVLLLILAVFGIRVAGAGLSCSRTLAALACLLAWTAVTFVFRHFPAWRWTLVPVAVACVLLGAAVAATELSGSEARARARLLEPDGGGS